jgi:hypothetical protein
MRAGCPASPSRPREPGVTAETLDYAFLHVLDAVRLNLDEEHRVQRITQPQV